MLFATQHEAGLYRSQRRLSSLVDMGGAGVGVGLGVGVSVRWYGGWRSEIPLRDRTSDRCKTTDEIHNQQKPWQ